MRIPRFTCDFIVQDIYRIKAREVISALRHAVSCINVTNVLLCPIDFEKNKYSIPTKDFIELKQSSGS